MGLFNFPWARKPVEDKQKPQGGESFGARFGNDPQTSRALNAFRGAVSHPHPTLLYQRSKAGAGYRGGEIDLLVETIEKDPYIMGLVQHRVDNVLHMDDAILQYDQTPQAIRASKLIDRVEEHVGGFDQLMFEALYRAVPFGISVHEVAWDYREFPIPAGKKRAGAQATSTDDSEKSSRWLIPVALRQVRQDRIGFDAEGRLLIRCAFKSDSDAAASGYTSSDDKNWWYPDPLNVLVFTRYTDYDSPYGYPILATLFFCAWFKRQHQIWWAQYNDRYTTPIHEVKGQKESYLEDGDKLAVKNFLLNITRHTSFRPPPGWELKVHELMASGAVTTYSQMIQFCDDQAAVLLVGQTSTSVTSPQGSQAASQVHERNALAIYASDARHIENWINQFLRLIVAVNMPGAVHKCPRLNINTKSAAEVSKWVVDVLATGVGIGAKIPVREFFRITGLDEAQPGEDILKLPDPILPAGPNGKPPSQQPTARSGRTQDRANQRGRKAAPQSQAQPRGQK